MENYGIVILIMALMIGASGLAGKLRLPVPVLLIVTGMVAGFIPAIPPMINDILFLTIAVVVLSLLGQGLTLPWVVARFGKSKTPL